MRNNSDEISTIFVSKDHIDVIVSLILLSIEVFEGSTTIVLFPLYTVSVVHSHVCVAVKFGFN